MLSPLFAAAGGFFILGEPWRNPELVATVMSLSGAFLVAKPSFLFGHNQINENNEISSSESIGVVFALLSAVSTGLAYIFVRILGTIAKMPWSYVCFAQSLGQIALSLPCLLLFGQTLSLSLSPYQGIIILAGGIIGTWSQLAMTVGMQREKSASASAMRMSDVAFGFLWQAIFTSDDINFLSAIGAVMVMAGVMVIVIYKQVEVKKEVVEIEMVGVDNTSNENTESNISTKSVVTSIDLKGNSGFSRNILKPMTKIYQSTCSKLRIFQGNRGQNDQIIENNHCVKYAEVAQSDSI
jgi:uncharacterized membrane protein